MLRELVSAGGEIASSVWSEEGETRARAGGEGRAAHFRDCRGQRARQGLRQRAPGVPALIDQIDDLYNNPNKPRGLPTGFIDFDSKTGGLRGGDLLIIAGRPSMGKRTLAINMAEHAALKEGIRASVAIFSLEMPAEQILTRMLSSVGSVQPGQHPQRQAVRGRLAAHHRRHQAVAGREDLHRRHAGADAHRIARAFAAHQARARARPHRRGLSTAHVGAGHEGKSRHRDLRDLARPQGAGEGNQLPGDRAVAVESRRGTAREARSR